MGEIQFDDVNSILSEFSELPDPRCDINRKHLLGDLLVICIMSVIAGCDGPQAIGTWSQINQQWHQKHLFGPSLLKQQDDKHSIAMRRRIAGWSLDYLAKVLGIPVLWCAFTVPARGYFNKAATLSFALLDLEFA